MVFGNNDASRTDFLDEDLVFPGSVLRSRAVFRSGFTRSRTILAANLKVCCATAHVVLFATDMPNIQKARKAWVYRALRTRPTDELVRLVSAKGQWVDRLN